MISTGIKYATMLLTAVLLAGCATTPPVADLNEPVPDKPYVSLLDDPASNALFHYGRAQMLLGEGAVEPATAALQAAIQLDPESLDLRYFLAQLYGETGRLKESRRTLEDLLIQEPQAVEALISLGNMALAHGAPAEALDYFKQVMEIEPDHAMVPLQQAIALVRLGEIDQAIETLQQLLERHPDSRPGRLTLGRLYRDMGLTQQAEAQYRYLIENLDEVDQAYLDLGFLYENQRDWENALATYQEAVKLNPYDASLRHHLARIYIGMEAYDRALAELQAIVETEPYEVEARRKIGLIYLELERWEDAETVFAEILQLDPDLEPARYYLGTVLERQEKWQEALDVFWAIPQTSSLYADTIAHLGFLLLQLERSDDAAVLLEDYLDTGEARPQIYDYLAIIYQTGDRMSEALHILERGALQFPDDVDLLYQQGIVLEKLQRHKQALDVMIAVIEKDPEHAEALNFVAYAYAEANSNLDKALELAHRAFALKPAGHIHDTLGWVYYRLGRHAEARRELDAAHRMLPEDTVVLEHLAEVMMMQKEYASARDMYRQLLELDPDNPLPKAQLDALEDLL